MPRARPILLPNSGYGRLNAQTAAQLAVPARPAESVVITRTYSEPVHDFQTATVALEVGEAVTLASVTVQVDIEHSYIGDLEVTLIPPVAMQASAVTLHKRTGGGTKNLRRTYDVLNAPALQAYQGKSAQGMWQLAVHDAARADVGTIHSFGLALTFAPPPRPVAAPARRTVPHAVKVPRPARPAQTR